MKISQVPEIEPGTYHGKFVRVAETTHDEYGPGARWDFEIDEGPYAGAIVSRTTKPVASNRNTCGAFCEMVAALPVEAAIQHDTDNWVGVRGTVVVERSPSSDAVRVAQFTRDPDQPSDNADMPF